MKTESNFCRRIVVLAFLFVLIFGSLLQHVVLEKIFPERGNGHGLLSGSDGDLYHTVALGEYERIQSDGFRAWSLVPTENKLLISGVLSFLYSLFNVQSPLLFLPIAALVHALSAFLIFRILRIFQLNVLSAFVGTLLFVVFPASYFWTMHPHKEGFYILGVLLLCFSFLKGFVREASPSTIWLMLSFVFGFLLIWGVRPYLVDVFALGFLVCGIVLVARDACGRSFRFFPVFLMVVAFGAFFLPQFYEGPAMPDQRVLSESIIEEVVIPEKHELSKTSVEEVVASEQRKLYKEQIGGPISVVFKQIASCRSYFLEQHVAAGLVIDSKVNFVSDLDMIAYLPRAIMVGLVAPLGFCSFSMGSLFFGIHSVFFLMCLVVVLIWVFKNKKAWIPFACLAFLFGMEMVLRVLVTPNAGSLWRYLFAGKSLVISFGVAVAFGWVKRWFGAYRKHRHARIINETVVVVVGKVLTITGALFGVRMMTEFLPQEIYGELTLFLSVILVSQYIFGAALEQTAMRYYSIAMQKQAGRLYLKKLLEWFAVASVVLFILIVLLRSFLIPSLSPLLLLCIIVFAVAGVGVNLGCGIQSAARNRLLVSGLQVAFEWLRYLLAVLFILFFSVSVSSVLFGFVFASVFVLFAYAVSITKLPIFKKSVGEQKETRFRSRYFWVMSLGGFFTWIQVFADRWCIARFLTPSDVGIYQALYQISFSPSLIGSAMLLTIIAPILFHHSKDGQNVLEMSAVLKNYNKVILFLLLTCLGIFLLAWMLRDVVPTVLLGKEYRDVSQYFPWMVLSGVLFMLSQQIMLSLCAGMRIGAVLIIRAVMAIVAVVCYGVGTALWGITGAVCGGIFLAFISVGLNVAFHAALKRSYGSKRGGC